MTEKSNLTDDQPHDELEGLLERLCLGELDPNGWRRVGDLIRDDRAAAKRYIQVAHYCETLRDETSGSTHERIPGPSSDGDSGEGTAPRRFDPASLADQLAGRSNRRDGKTSRTSSGKDRESWSVSRFLPWGLAVCAAFLCGWFLRAEPTVTSVAVQPVKLSSLTDQTIDNRNKQGQQAKEAVEPLGRVTGLTPAASSDGLLRSLKVGSLLRRGEVFQLTSGAARLEIAGGEVLVEGPAELSAIDTRTVFVREGRVTVRHPKKMTIQTPLAVVSGTGAAYAVVAEAGLGATVAALEGEIVVDTAAARGACGKEACHLTASETLEISVDESDRLVINRNASRPDGLFLAWEETEDRLHDYERLVLADKPLAYWPLNRVRRHRAVLDLTQNGFDGYAIGNWPTELVDPHASQSRGSYFDGESYIESDHKPPVDLRTGFTIESWARVSGGPEYQSIFTSRWVLASNTDHEQCFGFTLYAGKNDQWQFWTGSGEYAANWNQLHANATVVRNEWTHVTASFEPDAGQEDAIESITGTVRIFVEGEKVAEAKHELSLEDFEWPARIGAAEFVPQSLTSWLFKGELRDVALYDHVLPTKRIRTHAEQGRSAS